MKKVKLTKVLFVVNYQDTCTVWQKKKTKKKTTEIIEVESEFEFHNERFRTELLTVLYLVIENMQVSLDCGLIL